MQKNDLIDVVIDEHDVTKSFARRTNGKSDKQRVEQVAYLCVFPVRSCAKCFHRVERSTASASRCAPETSAKITAPA